MEKGNMTIRPMSADDKEPVMRLLRATPEFYASEVDVAEEVMEGYLASPGEDYRALVAEDAGGISGFICFGQTPLTASTWDIYWLAVDKIRRGLGTGSAMLQAAEAAISEKNGHLILVETSGKPLYLPTRRFYRKNGYRRCCTIKDFYTANDHLVIFEKRI
jgi:ribosomal protein S18 acetylase RimI-like enzyme